MKQEELPNIGLVTFTARKGSRRITIAIHNDGSVKVTMPYAYPQKLAIQYVINNTDKIIATQKRLQKHSEHIEETITQSREKFTHFRNLIVITNAQKSHIQISSSAITIMVRTPELLINAKVQEQIKTQIISVLRKEAQQYIPQRVSELAVMHHFTFSNVRISSAQGRWGSCNTLKNLSISLYIMTLPYHLIDYVLLHELCHTIYMNHSKAFYNLLNQCVEGKHLQYLKELKDLHTTISPKFTIEAE